MREVFCDCFVQLLMSAAHEVVLISVYFVLDNSLWKNNPIIHLLVSDRYQAFCLRYYLVSVRIQNH